MPSHDDSGLADEQAITSRGAAKMADKTATAEPKWVYAFAAGYVDGRANMTELLGGKGANLAEMASLGLHVPPVSPSRPRSATPTMRMAANFPTA